MAWSNVNERYWLLVSSSNVFYHALCFLPLQVQSDRNSSFQTVVFCNHINFYTLLGLCRIQHSLLVARQRPNRKPHCSAPMQRGFSTATGEMIRICNPWLFAVTMGTNKLWSSECLNRKEHCEVVISLGHRSAMLRNVNWWFVSDVSGDRVGPILKGQMYKKNDAGQHRWRSKASTTPRRKLKILLPRLTTVNYYSGLNGKSDKFFALPYWNSHFV